MYTGKELVKVHIEEFRESPTIQFRHGFTGPIYVQCYYIDGTMFFPRYIKRKDTIWLDVYLNQLVPESYVSVFSITQLVSYKKINISGNNEYTLKHNMYFDDFLIQVWNNNDEVVFPNEMKKVDYENVYLSFSDTVFDGYVNFIGTYPNTAQSVFNTAAYEWIYKYRNIATKHVAVQTKYLDGSTFMPKDIISENINPDRVSDNVVVINNNSQITGKVSALTTGIRA